MRQLKVFDTDNRFIEPSKESYDAAKASYIANYTEYEPGYATGGFFSTGWRDGKYVHKPDIALVKWNELYPSGYADWLTNNGPRLSSYGLRRLVAEHDKLVRAVNKLIKQQEKSDG